MLHACRGRKSRCCLRRSAESARKAFWRRAAICGDNDDLPFRRFDSAGRPTPKRSAASVTDMPGGMMCFSDEGARMPGAVRFSGHGDPSFRPCLYVVCCVYRIHDTAYRRIRPGSTKFLDARGLRKSEVFAERRAGG